MYVLSFSSFWHLMYYTKFGGYSSWIPVKIWECVIYLKRRMGELTKKKPFNFLLLLIQHIGIKDGTTTNIQVL